MSGILQYICYFIAKNLKFFLYFPDFPPISPVISVCGYLMPVMLYRWQFSTEAYCGQDVQEIVFVIKKLSLYRGSLNLNPVMMYCIFMVTNVNFGIEFLSFVPKNGPNTIYCISPSKYMVCLKKWKTSLQSCYNYTKHIIIYHKSTCMMYCIKYSRVVVTKAGNSRWSDMACISNKVWPSF